MVLLASNKGNGLSAEEIVACDHAVAIPMVRYRDSLDVSVATSVVLYHVFSQLSSYREDVPVGLPNSDVGTIRDHAGHVPRQVIRAKEGTMTESELWLRIQNLKNELARLIRSEADLVRPEVLAKSRELDGLVISYHKLTGQNPMVHSERNDGHRSSMTS